MNPYKDMQESEKVLKKLISEAKNSNNSINRLKELNVIIKTINNYDEMLKNKYYTDFFDTMILSRMYQTLIKSPQGEININEFLLYYDQDLRLGKEFIKTDIVNFIKGRQLDNSIKKGNIFTDSSEFWGEKLENLLKQIKTKIIWNKKWN